MHQPYYKNLLTKESPLPWVRLHGLKDYVDMVEILGKFPKIHQTINMVPSLLEQVEDYTNNEIKDRYLELSYKSAETLTDDEKRFIKENFFSINRDTVIATHPRYYQLYFKAQNNSNFTTQDYLDLQVWFNLAWTDPSFRASIPELKKAVAKGRFYTEEDKRRTLEAQNEILKNIFPAYKKFISNGQIELTMTPYYHPILPLLYNTKIAREANTKATLPKTTFSYPQDAKAQIDMAVDFYKTRFNAPLDGMWPSEEAVCEHILPYFMEAGLKWIVADEGILFKSLKLKKRDTRLLYQPHILRRKDQELAIVFRDRNLSDLIGFLYYKYKTEDAVNDFMKHLENTAAAFKNEDVLLTIAMDGENAWEYYPNDGHDFLELLYKRLSEADFVKTTTVKEYLVTHPPKNEIKRIAAGSWIYTDFFKWINNPYKNKAWEYLTEARNLLEEIKDALTEDKRALAFKQIYIAEGSDWFWWYGDNQADFDALFRMHLSNFYTIISKEIPSYLLSPLNARNSF